MTRTIALVISAAYLLGTTGLAMAQTSTTTPAPTTTAPAPTPGKTGGSEDKAKKAAAASEKKLANCMQKAGTDDAKKAACQKAAEKGMTEKQPAKK